MKTSLLVNGVPLAGLTLSEVFDAFRYLVTVRNREMERYEHNPMAPPTVRLIPYEI